MNFCFVDGSLLIHVTRPAGVTLHSKLSITAARCWHAVSVCVGQQHVSSAYVSTLTFNGSCPSNVTSHRELMTSLSVELNRQAVCVWSRRLADVCDTSNYAVCPGIPRQRRRSARQTDRTSPLTLSIVLYVARTYVAVDTVELCLV